MGSDPRNVTFMSIETLNIVIQAHGCSKVFSRVVLDSYFRADSTLGSCDNPDDSTLTQLNHFTFLD